MNTNNQNTNERPTTATPRAVSSRLQEMLDRYNPGEQLSWPVMAAPQRIPEHCLQTLEAGGPALCAFFAAANRIFLEETRVQPIVEKRYHPNYFRINRAQPDAVPWNPRPDIVPDADWNPKFVELELTVGSRSDGGLMSSLYGNPAHTTSLHLYKEMLERRGLTEHPFVFLTAYHPAYEDLGNDGLCWSAMLREIGVDAWTLTDDDLPYLSYRNRRLRCLRPGRRFEFTHFDRLIDIFEIAETAHAGMRPLLDAYLDGQAVDVNTCKQFLDEKIWMALFWDPRLERLWQRHLSEEHLALLRRLIPFTTFITPDTQVRVGDSLVPIDRLHTVPQEERLFVTKESGTSETAGAAQSFYTLNTEPPRDVREHLLTLAHMGPPSILQDLVESAQIDFEAFDPETNRRMSRKEARVKMTAFYIDGILGDILFIASNKGYAVHNEDYVETVVDRRPVCSGGAERAS